MGYGHAKQALFELLIEHFAPARARRIELMHHPEVIEDILKKGAMAAREKATATVTRARAAVGLSAKQPEP
jgi:tryptophanyl-tRNA synthetase